MLYQFYLSGHNNDAVKMKLTQVLHSEVSNPKNAKIVQGIKKHLKEMIKKVLNEDTADILP